MKLCFASRTVSRWFCCSASFGNRIGWMNAGGELPVVTFHSPYTISLKNIRLKLIAFFSPEDGKQQGKAKKKKKKKKWGSLSTFAHKENNPFEVSFCMHRTFVFGWFLAFLIAVGSTALRTPYSAFINPGNAGQFHATATANLDELQKCTGKKQNV